MTLEEQKAWDEAIGRACEKVILTQTVFRESVQATEEMLKGLDAEIVTGTQLKELREGRALVKVLAAVIGNLSEMKGQYPW